MVEVKQVNESLKQCHRKPHEWQEEMIANNNKVIVTQSTKAIVITL